MLDGTLREPLDQHERALSTVKVVRAGPDAAGRPVRSGAGRVTPKGTRRDPQSGALLGTYQPPRTPPGPHMTPCRDPSHAQRHADLGDEPHQHESLQPSGAAETIRRAFSRHCCHRRASRAASRLTFRL